MEEFDNLKHEVENLRPDDRRWLLMGATLVVSIVLFVLFTGSAVGDVVAFAVVFAAGWLTRMEWSMVTNRSRRTPRPRGDRGLAS
jgi:hypothetical protein